ncbi:DSL1 [[Candida] subhashii]|uniref:DSL1 n=1 Tax=[Candida] subhashii TaxID=561895 RepID=A0A8J5QII6_9ASCO|nr:DSL1 [[Candida] subhashii]KAG7661627.1 DSL1 [[Candida] subhashii]
MSFDGLLVEQESYLENIDRQIDGITQSILIKSSLENDSSLRQQFMIEVDEGIQQETDENDLSNQSITQLNSRFEVVNKNIHELSHLIELNKKLTEIKSLLDKPKTIVDLLDLQQLHNLFRSTSITNSNSFIIYKQINKQYDNYKSTFIQQLNDYLKLLIPDCYSIVNISILSDFNSFISKNAYVLDTYNQYKLQWDEIIDSILSHDKQISVSHEEDEDSIAMALSDSSSPEQQPSFLLSLANFMKFINELNNENIRNYLNSKIQPMITSKISSNINQIINNEYQINELNGLVNLSRQTHWSILRRLENQPGGAIDEKLNKLYFDWIIDGFIDRIRNEFKNSSFEVVEEVEFDIPEEIEVTGKRTNGTNNSISHAPPPQPAAPVIEAVPSKAEDDWNAQWSDDDNEPVNQDADADSWNDQWENSWDEDDHANHDRKQKSGDEQEDNWNDQWEEDWDEEEDTPTAQQSKPDPKEKTLTPTPAQPIIAPTPIESKTIETKQVQKKGSMQITQLPNNLITILEEFKSHSIDLRYIVSAIESLSLVTYTPLSSSFLMYNDFQYLSSKSDISEFINFVESQWNQVRNEYYSEFESILSGLDLGGTSGDEGDNYDDILDDYNMGEVSKVYEWLNKLFEKKQYLKSNKYKFKQLIIELMNYGNKWLISKIVELPDISEMQCNKITQVIDSLNNVTIPILQQIQIPKDSVESYSKLNNVQFLLNNHLRDIMDRFYAGDLYDLTTEELIRIIRNVFIQSDVRDSCINEIIEFRTMN